MASVTEGPKPLRPLSVHFFKPPKHPHKIAQFRIEADFILDIFRGLDGQRLLKCSNIPADARVVGLTVDEIYNTVCLYIESETFPDVEEGCMHNSFDLTIQQNEPALRSDTLLVFDVSE